LLRERLPRGTFLGVVAAGGLALSGLPAAASPARSVAIRIGVVVDSTGASKGYGPTTVNGLRLAATDINKAGGINGHPLELAVADAASSTSRVMGLYKQYIADKRMLAIIGPSLSDEAFKADPLAQAAGMPVLAVTNAAVGVPSIGSYIFRVSMSDSTLIPLTLRTAQSKLHLKSVAIIYGKDNAYTLSAGTLFASNATKLGLKVVASQIYATGDTSFKQQLSLIKLVHPDAILVGALPPQAIAIMKQGRALGIPASVRFIGGSSFASQQVVDGASSASEGMLVATQWSLTSPTPLNRPFKAAYAAAYHTVPDRYAALAYDGLHVLAAALRKAGTTSDRAAVRAALAAVKGVPVVSGLSGTFSFSPDREAQLTPIVQTVQGGKFVDWR